MPKQTTEQKVFKTWWMHFVLALIFIALSYGFISLALDSAHLWEYAVGILLFIWALRYLIYGVKHAIHR